MPSFPRRITTRHSPQPDLPVILRWQQAWNESLRFRLLVLGLTPLLMAFPFVIAVLIVVGGERADSMLIANLRSNLAGARNYLNQIKTETGVRIGQLVQSERLVQLLHKTPDHRELNQMLATAAKGSGLDFLIVATPAGSILGSSTGGSQNTRLPDSFVIRQATIGVATAAFERFEPAELDAFSPYFTSQAHLDQRAEPDGARQGLLINAAAHFPLTADSTDAILIGGILLNRNFALIEHMREIIYPVGSLPGNAEGISVIYLGDTSIAIRPATASGARRHRHACRRSGQGAGHRAWRDLAGQGKDQWRRIHHRLRTHRRRRQPAHRHDRRGLPRCTLRQDPLAAARHDCAADGTDHAGALRQFSCAQDAR